MSPRTAAARADAEVDSRRHGVLGALAAALPDRTARRGEAERPALEVVAPAARRRRSWQVGTVAGGLLFLAMFVIVGAQTLIVQQQRHIDDVNGRIAAAEDQAERLEIDLAELQSPERIVNEARDRLGHGAGAVARLPAAPAPTTTPGPPRCHRRHPAAPPSRRPPRRRPLEVGHHVEGDDPDDDVEVGHHVEGHDAHRRRRRRPRRPPPTTATTTGTGTGR